MPSSYEQREALWAEQRTLGDYFLILYRRRWLILFVAAVAGAAAWIASGRLTPRYEAETEFYVPEDIAGPVLGPEQGKTRLPSGEREHAKAFITVLEGLEARKELHERFPSKSIVDLRRDVDISVDRRGIIQLYVRDYDPQAAADVANGFVEYFDEFNERIVRDQINRTLGNVDTSLEEAKGRRSELEDARQRYKEEHNVAGLATRVEQLEMRLQTLRQSLRQAEIDRSTLEEQIHGLEEQLALEESTYAAHESVLTSGPLEAIQKQLVDIELELASKRVEYKPEHLEIVTLEKRRDQARHNLEQELARLVASKSKPVGSLYENLRAQLTNLLVERVATSARAQALEQATQRVAAEIAELPTIATELERFDRRIGAQQMEILGFEEQRNQLTRQSLQLRSSAIVLQRAEVSVTPIFPLPILNVCVAALAGLVVGLFYALLLDYIDTRRYLQKLRYLETQDWARALIEEGDAAREGGASR